MRYTCGVNKLGALEPPSDVGTSNPTSCLYICLGKNEANIQISNNLPLWQNFWLKQLEIIQTSTTHSSSSYQRDTTIKDGNTHLQNCFQKNLQENTSR